MIALTCRKTSVDVHGGMLICSECRGVAWLRCWAVWCDGELGAGMLMQGHEASEASMVMRAAPSEQTASRSYPRISEALSNSSLAGAHSSHSSCSTRQFIDVQQLDAAGMSSHRVKECSISRDTSPLPCRRSVHLVLGTGTRPSGRSLRIDHLPAE